jgi:hypothetical protein
MPDMRPIDLAPPLADNKYMRRGTPALVATIMAESNRALLPAKELIHCVMA